MELLLINRSLRLARKFSWAARRSAVGCLAVLCWSAPTVSPLSVAAATSDREYYQSLSAGPWVTIERGGVASSAAQGELGWAVRDGQLRILWPSPGGSVARAVRMRLRDARQGSERSFELRPSWEYRGDCVRLFQRVDEWGVEVEAILIPRGGHLEAAVQLRGVTQEDAPLRVEFAVDASGSRWRWWDDGRRSRPAVGATEYANLTRVLAGYDGQMSRYPLACITSEDEALVLAVPLLRPRVFQLVYDGASAEYRLAVDVALSPRTLKFPNEATFFFALYSADPAQGFRGAFDRYRGIYPDAFVKRVTQEGVWMPFTRINDVLDAEDFHFGFHEYGAVDLDYNRRHRIYSFLYVEPWTYWMAMPADVPRETDAAMRLLEKNASEGDAWNRPMARATLLSAVYDAKGEPAHQFVDQPWCNGALFFNNSDPDIATSAEEDLNTGRLNLDIARREVVESERVVIPGWDPYAEGYRVDREHSLDAGSRSLLMERALGDGDGGAVQVVQLDQQEAMPLWVGGYSRAEDVSPGAAINYAIYADLTYQNGSNSWGHAVGFDAGSHSWQQREMVIIPAAPIKTVKLHALFRGERTGRAWFDGLALKEIPAEWADAIQVSPWEAFERGFSEDGERPHRGKRSIRVDRSSMQAPGGALLRIAVNQESPAPLAIRAWSRAKDVPRAPPDDDYAIFMDVYFEDGSVEYGVAVPFEIAEDWRVVERWYAPAKPIQTMNVHLLFRGAHTGTVWFDDVSVVDPSTGRDYAVDGGFERVGSRGAPAEWSALPNRLRDGDFAGTPIELKADGMYLDSLEGWANRLNFRADHFEAVDVPLVYETGSGRTAVFNLFSIFEFTQAMSEYLHAHDRLLMGNWVLIDFPFLGALLDVPGKEVHWLDSHQAFAPDSDETMLYRRMLSGSKPYPLLLNVQFEHFTPEMARKYFERSLFYAFYPGMFSHDAATNPYFENPERYNRDRDLFLRFIPRVRELSTAGWEPVTHAQSHHPQILVERYGQRPETGLYFALHHDGEGWGSARIEIDGRSLNLTNRVRLIDVMAGGVVAEGNPTQPLAFTTRLGDYGTRVIRVIEDHPAALIAYADEQLASVRDVVVRHEAQGKLTAARAGELRSALSKMSEGLASADTGGRLQALRRIQRLRDEAVEYGRVDFARAVAGAENAISDAVAERLGLSLSVGAPDVVVSPAESACRVVLENRGSGAFEIRSVRLALASGESVCVGADPEPSTILASGQSSQQIVNFSVPAGAGPDSECVMRVAVEGVLTARDGTPHPVTFARTIRARVVAGLELRMAPGRLLSSNAESEWIVTVANHQERQVDVQLSVHVNGRDAPTLSWTQETVGVEAGDVRAIPLRAATPEPGLRATYSVEVSAVAAGAEWGRATGALTRFPSSQNLLTDPNVEVRVDSTFAGYSVGPLRDGILDTADLDWSESAWASADIAVPHWVEVRWPAPQRITAATVHWAKDNETYFRSTHYRLQFRRNESWEDWSDASREESEAADQYRAAAPLLTDGLRLWQEVGGGSRSRPNLLWVRELDVRGE